MFLIRFIIPIFSRNIYVLMRRFRTIATIYKIPAATGLNRVKSLIYKIDRPPPFKFCNGYYECTNIALVST